MKTVIRLTTHNYDKEKATPEKERIIKSMFEVWKETVEESLWERTIFPDNKNYKTKEQKEAYIQSLLGNEWKDLMDKYNADTEAAIEERDAREKEAYRLACKHQFKLDEHTEDILEFDGISKPEFIKYEGELLKTGNAVLDIFEKCCIINVRRNKLI